MNLFEILSEVAEIFQEKLVNYLLRDEADGTLLPVPFLPMMMAETPGENFSRVFETERQKEIFNKVFEMTGGWVKKHGTDN